MGFFDRFSFEFSFGKKQPKEFAGEVPVTIPELPPLVTVDFIKEIVKTEVEHYVANPQINEIPIVGGRVSVPENVNQLSQGIGFNIEEDYPFHLLRTLEILSIANNHVSYAVENVVTLAHTEKEVFFADTVGDKMAQKMKQHIKEAQTKWYDFSTGEDGLINDCFAQLATFGCLSNENIPTSDLKGIKKVVRVSPYNIRFAYDADKDDYIPLQTTTIKTKGRFPGHVELNPATYNYIALKRFKTSPYPVPPFIAALEDLVTEKDMKGSFKAVMKKLGMLGFFTALVNAPKQRPGESEQDYQVRTLIYLESLRPQMENGFARGMTIGIKNAHEFKLEGSNINADAGEKLMKLIKMSIFSGLKQDPNMHGENYSTTETFGRVILAKMSKQAENYQKVVETYLEKLYMLELILAGYNPGYVEVKFRPPMIGDVKRDEETEALRIANVTAKYEAGIISQLQRAQELGYDKPDQEEPRAKAPEAGAGDIDEEETGKEPEMKVAAESVAPEDMIFETNQAMFALGAYVTPYDYTVPEGCGMDADILSFDEVSDYHDATLERFITKYSGAVRGKFQRAVKAALPGIKRDLKKLDADASAQRVIEVFFYHLYKDWDRNFKKRIKYDVRQNITRAYSTYRRDKKIFSAGSLNRGMAFDDGDIPAPVFELLDFRAIEYLKDLDNLYLGKFITDEDTRQRIKDWISDQYLQENWPIGKNSQMMDEFNKQFSDKVMMEDFKIRRVVETTLNKARNYANVNYIAQAEIEEFEIVEVMDQKTCEYCQHMNGKTFSVATAKDKIERVVNGKPSEVPKLSPFATKIPLEEFKKMDAQSLQAAGIDTPGYHCHCRGRVVARI
jgi:SPP1 gp7 family putative phage head morphogenesis protein